MSLIEDDSENSEQDTSEIFSESDKFVLIYQRFVAHITSGQRHGQAWMNALHDVDARLYESLHGTEADCFYNDRNIDAFKRVVFNREE